MMPRKENRFASEARTHNFHNTLNNPELDAPKGGSFIDPLSAFRG
ncbi:hypothetical protein VAE122_170001 [Vibrio aestuarianus]|nr:hypothetical protein VAE122_170001 [Vibrio aestuarianus]